MRHRFAGNVLSENPSSPVGDVARHFPAPDYEQQDEVYARPFDILKRAIVEQAFPAASVAVIQHGRLAALKAFGRFTYELGSPEASATTIFDLASVSKVVATTTMAMILFERGLLDLEAPAIAVVPEFGPGDPRRNDVTLRMLLAHSSGLPAHDKFYLRARTPAEVLSLAFSTPLTAEPGSRSEYSDIGFIILGVILERIADESLDRFCQREVFGALGMSHTAFNPPAIWHSFIPPTADDRSFRNRIVQGEVQDENAFALGGVAGHAGVFSTANDLAIFANAMLNRGRPIVRPETLDTFTRREPRPEGTSRSIRLGHSFASFSGGKILFIEFVRPLGLHRYVFVDRRPARTGDHFADQSDLAGLRQPGNQNNPPTFSRRVIEALKVE